jgi:hypothetical protein
MNETTVMDPCVECGQSTAFGFGRFVNRLWVDGDGEHIGYQCIECLGSVFDCDRCDEPIPFDEDIVEVTLDHLGYQVEWRVCEGCATIQVPTKKPRTWAQVQADPRVGSTSDPAGGDEGYWVYLVPSFYSPVMGCRTIHEDTVRAAIDELVRVERCDPDERF